MKRADLERMFNRHCRLKLKSGKEVYGVLWEDPGTAESKIFFASLGEMLQGSPGKKEKQQSKTNIGEAINIEEIVAAEPISE